MSAISRDVLANRRSHDICDRGECFYPTVIQLAEEVERLENGLRRIRQWDCLNPPRADLLADLPWLAREIDALLADSPPLQHGYASGPLQHGYGPPDRNET